MQNQVFLDLNSNQVPWQTESAYCRQVGSAKDLGKGFQPEICVYLCVHALFSAGQNILCCPDSFLVSLLLLSFCNTMQDSSFKYYPLLSPKSQEKQQLKMHADTFHCGSLGLLLYLFYRHTENLATHINRECFITDQQTSFAPLS